MSEATPEASHQPSTYHVRPVGCVKSSLTEIRDAPKQGDEGAPSAHIVLRPEFAQAAADLHVGIAILVLTWLHQSSREVLTVRPRGDPSRPIHGVFSTRSPERPNPIGIHTVAVETVQPGRITVSNLEAVDGTPVLDIKPVLSDCRQR